MIDGVVTKKPPDRHVSSFERREGPIQQVRNALRSSCLAAADGPTDCYTLAAPTGSGKTLSMLSFALKHAVTNGLRRIVFVLPFLTIAEQTASVIREALAELPGFEPDTMVLEDHGLADAGSRPQGVAGDTSREDNRPDARSRRLLAENWDAPIIVTSSVKCLESLHASRPSACRKLHRLAKSVLLFDEVQTPPPRLSVCTLATRSHLFDRYDSTVGFATAATGP